MAPHTALQVDDSLLWLATTETGSAAVVESKGGLQVKPVSNARISNMIAKAANLQNAFAVSYSYGSHSFYVLTLPDAGLSLAYDLSTGMWHELSTSGDEWDIGFIYNTSSGTFSLGRKDSNTTNALTFNTFGDENSSVERTRISPVIHADDKRLIYNSVEIEVGGGSVITAALVDAPSKLVTIAGVDLTTLSISTGTDYIYNPITGTSNVISTVLTSLLVMADTPDFVQGAPIDIRSGTTDETLLTYDLSLRYKDNDGVWSTARTKTVTASTDRLIFRKLGSSRNRVFEVSTDNNYKIIIKSAYANVSVGTI